MVVLEEAELVEVKKFDKLIIGYLGVLLEQNAVALPGPEEEKLKIQHIIDSLCVN